MDSIMLPLASLGVAHLFERYRPTTHGPNPWTLEALGNVAALAPLFDRAAALVDGTITSCFRSAEVNIRVGGSPTSDHLAGRAVDLVPRLMSPAEAARVLFEAAERGGLGNVREVLQEPKCVHVGWYPIGVAGKVRLGTWRM